MYEQQALVQTNGLEMALNNIDDMMANVMEKLKRDLPGPSRIPRDLVRQTRQILGTAGGQSCHILHELRNLEEIEREREEIDRRLEEELARNNMDNRNRPQTTNRASVGLWATSQPHNKQLEQGAAIDVSNKIAGNSVRKRAVTDLKVVADTPLRKRTNLRALAAAIGKPKSTVHEWVKRGMLRSHSNAIKPYLTDANKITRLRFCLDHVDPYNMGSMPKFKTFNNVLHIDEEWFFMSKTSQRFYLLPDEADPYRACK
ncbi:unnamed protein product [Cuscuta campestris]|uniref:Transposase Tc1-like domain-containing protein n=1 Tax=Cuscuta campestris TaxID=132261 RepID=A0A484LAH9_9ASTE|nr:unnamed protein product [Cuscuta campestris]